MQARNGDGNGNGQNVINAIAAEFGLDRIALKRFLQKVRKEVPQTGADKSPQRRVRGPSKQTLKIKEAVLQAIAAGKRTSQDICASLPTATAPQVFAALRELEKENRIVKIGVILRDGLRGKKPAVWSIERRGKTNA